MRMCRQHVDFIPLVRVRFPAPLNFLNMEIMKEQEKLNRKEALDKFGGLVYNAVNREDFTAFCIASESEDLLCSSTVIRGDLPGLSHMLFKVMRRRPHVYQILKVAVQAYEELVRPDEFSDTQMN